MRLRKSELQLASLAILLAMVTSCTTTYDPYGRPVQSVDPGLALAGIAAAGLIGYAIANDNGYGGRKYHRSKRCSRCGGYHYGSRCGGYYY